MSASLPTVRDIDPRGPVLRLSDGSSWQIRPGADAMALRYWSVGDPVQVEEADEDALAYRLTNPNTPGRKRPIAARPA